VQPTSLSGYSASYSLPALSESPQKKKSPVKKDTCGNGADLTLYACAEGCAALFRGGEGTLGTVECLLGGGGTKMSGPPLACILNNSENVSNDNDRCLNSCMRSWSTRNGGCLLP
jgi:hypothetical protein